MDISIDHIRDVVTNWADSYHEITRVFLFGSRARGDSTPDSDIDLAIVVVGNSDETAFTRYFFNQNDWKRELGSALGRSISMVRVIDHGKPEVQESIAREGVLLYERPYP
jgi:predicted nucleotidyltransferase